MGTVKTDRFGYPYFELSQKQISVFPDVIELECNGRTTVYYLERRIYLSQNEEGEAVNDNIIGLRYTTAKYMGEHCDEIENE